MYIVHTKERHVFSLVCILKKEIVYFEVKVDVQKRVLRFIETIDNK